MKKLITLIIIIPLFSFGQVNVKGTNGATYTFLTQAQVNTAISNAVSTVVKNQAQVDAVQNTRLAVVEKGDTTFYDKRYFTIVGKNIYFNVDSAAKYMKIPAPVVDLTAINNNLTALNKSNNDLTTRVTLMESRTTQLENWRVLSQADIDALKLYMNKLKGLTLSNTLPQ